LLKAGCVSLSRPTANQSLAKEMVNAQIQEVAGLPEAGSLLAQAHQKPTAIAVFSLATGLAPCGRSIGAG